MKYQVNYDVLPMTGQLAGRRYHKTKKFETLKEAKHFAGCEGFTMRDDLGLFVIADAQVLDLTEFLVS